MAVQQDNKKSGERRLQRFRERGRARGSKRVEVTVPEADAAFLKAVAGLLRAGGPDAARLKAAAKPFVSATPAKTGAELVAFFRASPLVGADLDVERDRSAGRDAHLG